jgi:hypothetical protein
MQPAWCFEDGWYLYSIMVSSELFDEQIHWSDHQLGYSKPIITTNFNTVFYFKTAEHALMFKVGFGGEYNYDPRDIPHKEIE